MTSPVSGEETEDSREVITVQFKANVADRWSDSIREKYRDTLL